MTDPLFTQDDVKMLTDVLHGEAHYGPLANLRARLQSWLDQQKTVAALPTAFGYDQPIDQATAYVTSLMQPHRFSTTD